MADKARIIKLVTDIIVRKLGVDPTKITPGVVITKDLGADSLDTVEIIMDVEETFQLTIKDSDLETISTVGDIITYLEAHLP